jgi:hypothetical protein
VARIVTRSDLEVTVSKRPEAQADGPTVLGDFDPSDPAQLATVVRQATKFFAGAILGLSTAGRADLEAEAQLASLEAASNFSAETAKTTPWKHATNAANYAARRSLRSRMVEVPVSQFPSRADAGEADAGETLEADILEDDLPWYRDEDNPSPAYRPTKEELATSNPERLRSGPTRLGSSRLTTRSPTPRF